MKYLIYFFLILLSLSIVKAQIDDYHSLGIESSHNEMILQVGSLPHCRIGFGPCDFVTSEMIENEMQSKPTPSSKQDSNSLFLFSSFLFQIALVFLNIFCMVVSPKTTFLVTVFIFALFRFIHPIFIFVLMVIFQNGTDRHLFHTFLAIYGFVIISNIF